MKTLFITDPEERKKRRMPPRTMACLDLMRELEPYVEGLLDKALESGSSWSGPKAFSDRQILLDLTTDLEHNVLMVLFEPVGCDYFTAYEDFAARNANEALVAFYYQFIGTYRNRLVPLNHDDCLALTKVINDFRRDVFEIIKKHFGTKSRPDVDMLPFSEQGEAGNEWQEAARTTMGKLIRVNRELHKANMRIADLSCEAIMGQVYVCQACCSMNFNQSFPRASLAIKAKADEKLQAVVRRVREEAIRPYVDKQIDKDETLARVVAMSVPIYVGFERALGLDGNEVKPSDLMKARAAAMQFGVCASHYLFKYGKEGADA